MSEAVQLKELQSMTLDDSGAKQLGKMMELLAEDNFFSLDHSPRGENMKAEGCIGVMSFKDGTMVNLIPDMKSIKSDDGSSRILMEMLYSVFGMSTKNGMVDNLFEFFVKVFIDTVNKLIVRGLRSKYHLVRGNEKSFKGKIVFNEHIRQNYIHKERIFVEYEYYSQNRPENRLIKTTLEVLSRRTTDSSNIKGLKTLILGLEEIPSSVDVEKDFSQVIIDRNMVDYISPMLWCNLFLKGMGLAGASKDNLSYAMLIRTEDLYSAYVAKMSTIERTEGMYQIRYNADVRNEGDAKGVSVIMIDLDWSYYDRQKDETVNDAEALYLSAPGYRVIPDVGGNRLRSMAGSYLSDVLV
jgi:hypothetical protein